MDIVPPLEPPLQIKSFILFTLNLFPDNSPIANTKASNILDFPEPLAPTILVNPLLKLILIFSLKLLKPSQMRDFKYTMAKLKVLFLRKYMYFFCYS